jgi:hypothetical protein
MLLQENIVLSSELPARYSEIIFHEQNERSRPTVVAYYICNSNLFAICVLVGYHLTTLRHDSSSIFSFSLPLLTTPKDPIYAALQKIIIWLVSSLCISFTIMILLWVSAKILASGNTRKQARSLDPSETQETNDSDSEENLQ